MKMLMTEERCNELHFSRKVKHELTVTEIETPVFVTYDPDKELLTVWHYQVKKETEAA